uniref:Zgc:110339 n=1 Tax=Scleropages formosus TaxID=113540 RepID=A0A8C9TQT6_SCLFO
MKGGFSQCRSVLITGSSRGLGLHMVNMLVNSPQRPNVIIATARNPATAQELQKIVESHPGVQCYVTSQASVERAFKEVASLVGPGGLNCLINNAAVSMSTDLEKVTAEAMLKTFESNAVSPLMVTKAFLPLLRAAAAQVPGMGIHRAAVVNMSSVLGSIQLNWGSGAYRNYAYRTSKAALNMVTRCLANDLGSEGILCMDLHPDLGGPHADLSVEESVSSVLSVVAGLSEKDHGGYWDYSGKILLW